LIYSWFGNQRCRRFLAFCAREIKKSKLRRDKTRMTSKGFDFFQTDPRQSAEFLIFNQSFLFKGDSEKWSGKISRNRLMIMEK